MVSMVLQHHGLFSTATVCCRCQAVAAVATGVLSAHACLTCSALNDSVKPFSLQNCRMTLMTLHTYTDSASMSELPAAAVVRLQRTCCCSCKVSPNEPVVDDQNVAHTTHSVASISSDMLGQRAPGGGCHVLCSGVHGSCACCFASHIIVITMM